MTNQNSQERRRSERLKTLNFVSYRDKDDQGRVIGEGMAKTLDISLNGALIELQTMLENPHIAELELALDDDVVAIPGLIVNQKETDEGNYRLQVEFKDLKPSILHKLQSYILSFRKSD